METLPASGLKPVTGESVNTDAKMIEIAGVELTHTAV